MAFKHINQRSTFYLFSHAFIQTQAHRPDDVRRELARRGFSPPIVTFLRLVVFTPALYWNVIWWNWGGLDWRDFSLGWLLTTIFTSTLALVVGVFMENRSVEIASAAVVGLAAVGFGIWYLTGLGEERHQG